MRLLVDTSIWIEHLRKGDARLADQLTSDQVLVHPLIIGELACADLRNRQRILALLNALPQVQVAEDGEVFHLIEAKRLHGRRLGWIDVHLLASALITRCALWTRDRPLARAAQSLGIGAHP